MERYKREEEEEEKRKAVISSRFLLETREKKNISLVLDIDSSVIEN